MKKILKSLLVLTLVVATVTGATRAWFTSNISAEDNEITTGTMRAAIDASDPVLGTAYNVVRDNGGGDVEQRNYFPVLSNMQPGETRSVYVAFRNLDLARSTLPFQYRFSISGLWDFNSEDTHVAVTRVFRFANGDCLGEVGCQLITDWLTALPTGWSQKVAVATLLSPDAGGYYGVNHVNYVLQPAEYSVYRIDFQLSTSAGNEYQGQTYRYAVSMDARQTNDVNALWN